MASGSQLLRRFKPFIIAAIYTALSLIAVRGLLLKPGTIGHIVDWYIPADSAYLERAYSRYQYVWSDVAQLGVSNTIYVYNHPLHMLLMAPGRLGISGDAVSKSLVIVVLVVSACTAYYLAVNVSATCILEDQGRKKERFSSLYLPGFLAGCVYAFGPLSFNMLLSGGATFLVSYAIAPLSILFLLGAIRKRTPKDALLASISLSFIAASIQIAILINLAALLIVVTSPNKKKGLLAFLAILFLESLLLMYWILPVASDLEYTVSQPLATEEVSTEQTLTWLDTRTDPLPRVLTTEWFLRRVGTSFVATEDIPGALLPLWVPAIFVIVLAAFSASYLYPRKDVILTFSLISLLLVGFAAGTKSPIRMFVLWCYEEGPQPLMGLFRYPSYWIKLVPLCYAALLGGVGAWISRLTSRLRVALSLVLVTSTLLWTAPFWDGILGGKIDVFRFPPELSQIDQHMLADKEYGRAMYLPPEAAVRFEETEYQKGGLVGIDMVTAYSPRPYFDIRRVWNQNSYDVIWLLQDALLSSPPSPGLSVLLGITNVKYLVLRQDVQPATARLGSRWDWQKVSGVLGESREAGVELVGEYPHMSLWRNNNWWPHVYSASALVKVPEGSSIACLPEIAAFVGEQERIAIVEEDIAPDVYQYRAERVAQGSSDQCAVFEQTSPASQFMQPPNIQFKWVSPTKYEIQVTEATDPYLLVFSESFHPQWALRIESTDEKVNRSGDGAERQDVRHMLVNGYANGWWIDRPGSYRAAVEFLPQRWYQIGAVISGSTLLLCLISLMVPWVYPTFRRQISKLRAG